MSFVYYTIKTSFIQRMKYSKSKLKCFSLDFIYANYARVNLKTNVSLFNFVVLDGVCEVGGRRLPSGVFFCHFLP